MALIATGLILLLTSANVGGHQVQLSNLVDYGGLFSKGIFRVISCFSDGHLLPLQGSKWSV